MRGTLEEYAGLKLELAQAVRSLMELARRSGDENSEQESRALLTRLAEDRFNLAVIGLFNRGKSSLINCILETSRLPTGVAPLTSVITTVGYGDRERLLIHTAGSSFPIEGKIDQLGEYVSEKGNPGNRLHVERAEIQMPAEVLRLGFFFVDTPGVGSAIAANTETTRRFLPEIDAAIFVTSFDSPLSQADMELLQELRRFVRCIFLTVNKEDLVTAHERDEALRFIRERIEAAFGSDAPPLYAVSARSGAGVPALSAALSDFLKKDKLRELLAGILRRVQTIVDREAIQAALRERSQSDPSEAARRHSDFLASVARLSETKESIMRDLQTTMAAELTGRMRVAIDSYLAKRNGNDEEKDFDRWLEQQRAVLRDAQIGIARDHARCLNDLIVEIDRIIATLSNAMPSAQPAIDVTPLFEEIPAIWTHVPKFDWHPNEGLLSSLPLIRRHTSRLQEQRKSSALEEFREQLLNMVVKSGENWVNRLADRFDVKFDAAVAAAESSFSAPVDQSAAFELQRVRDCLASARSTIEAQRPEERAIRSVAAEPMALAPGRCPLCERVRYAVFDFLSTEQYRLYAHEQRRQEYVANGGFCELHIWQYEKIASAQGACVSYAPLLSSLSGYLSELSAARSMQSIRSRLAEIRPDGARCPACRIARLAEETVIDEKNTGLDSILCLPHLSLILARIEDVQQANGILSNQARVYGRIAVDMQNYALKHDALRRNLMTESESSAPVRGLAAIAGEKDTVRIERET